MILKVQRLKAITPDHRSQRHLRSRRRASVRLLENVKGDDGDPRNVAHDKKLQQEKKHRGEKIAPEAEHAPQPGQKPALKDAVKQDNPDTHDEASGDASTTHTNL